MSKGRARLARFGTFYIWHRTLAGILTLQNEGSFHTGTLLLALLPTNWVHRLRVALPPSNTPTDLRGCFAYASEKHQIYDISTNMSIPVVTFLQTLLPQTSFPRHRCRCPSPASTLRVPPVFGVFFKALGMGNEEVIRLVSRP